MHKLFTRAIIVILLSVMAVATRAETLVGTNVDSRVVVGLRVAEAEVQKMLPEGWSVMPFPSGVLKGATALLSFIDTAIQRDADGKPIDPATRRAMAALALGRKAEGAPSLFILTIFTDTPEDDPYGVNRAADFNRTRSVSITSGGREIVADRWEITADGRSLTMSLSYAAGNRGWVVSEGRPHSAANPDFFRIYRYEELMDVVKATPVGKDIDGDFALSGDLPDLGAFMVGSEDVICILDLPVYVREVSLP